MIEMKDTERELAQFRVRITVLGALVLLCFGLLLLRLLWLQVIKHDEFATKADENRIALVPIVPSRGLILDRNGVVLDRKSTRLNSSH